MAANNTTLAWSYIHLQLNTSAPDPIGFAQVSGFYGPGAWAAWFLTLVGSWLAIVKAPGRVDSNMLLYLAGLNWVAADLLRHMIRLHILKQAHNPAWMKEAASVGAAFVVTWWGHFHASAQLAFCFQPVLDVADIDEMQRGLTLMIGSTLSAAALAASSWMLGPLEVSSQIPAIFWNGMEVKEIAQEKIALGHDMALALPASCGFYSLFAYLILATPVIWSKAISENLRDILSTPFSSLCRTSRTDTIGLLFSSRPFQLHNYGYRLCCKTSTCLLVLPAPLPVPFRSAHVHLAPMRGFPKHGSIHCLHIQRLLSSRFFTFSILLLHALRAPVDIGYGSIICPIFRDLLALFYRVWYSVHTQSPERASRHASFRTKRTRENPDDSTNGWCIFGFSLGVFLKSNWPE